MFGGDDCEPGTNLDIEVKHVIVCEVNVMNNGSIQIQAYEPQDLSEEDAAKYAKPGKYGPHFFLMTLTLETFKD